MFSKFLRESLLPALCLLLLLSFPKTGTTKMVIAKNGGGAPLIANTLEATTLAVSQGLEFLELPLVMSSDNHLLVYDDLTLNGRTDVATTFPNRNREDGGFYINDFTLSEIRQLRLTNIFDNDPLALTLPIPTLLEELSLIKTLESSLNTKVVIMLELKSPWFFQKNGQDISRTLLDLLDLIKYDATQSLYIQCFHPEELQKIHSSLLTERGLSFPLIQMIDTNDGEEIKVAEGENLKPYNYDWLFTNTGLRIVASYAQAIALPIRLITESDDPVATRKYLDNIHKAGLQLFVYPQDDRDDAPSAQTELPQIVASINELVEIDGLYSADYNSAPVKAEQQQGNEKQQVALPPFFSNLGLTPPPNTEKVLPPQPEITAQEGGMN